MATNRAVAIILIISRLWSYFHHKMLFPLSFFIFISPHLNFIGKNYTSSSFSTFSSFLSPLYILYYAYFAQTTTTDSINITTQQQCTLFCSVESHLFFLILARVQNEKEKTYQVFPFGEKRIHGQCHFGSFSVFGSLWQTLWPTPQQAFLGLVKVVELPLILLRQIHHWDSHLWRHSLFSLPSAYSVQQIKDRHKFLLAEDLLKLETRFLLRRLDFSSFSGAVESRT